MMSHRILMISSLFLLLVLLVFFLKPEKKEIPAALTVADALGGAADPGFARATAPRPFIFPADHGPHPGFRTEWWYYTGNLHTTSGRRFGYQLTFFRFTLAPDRVPRASRWGTNEIFMAHFTITDVEGKGFFAAERFSRAALGLAGAGGNSLALHLEDWSAIALPGESFGMNLNAGSGDEAIHLRLEAAGPVMLNGEGGLSRKGREPGNASYYYSIPRLATSGTIRVNGEEFSVTGLSWLDREWGTTALEPNQDGWDWFGLQLADGRALMFYRLRQKDGTTDPVSGGTLMEVNGSMQSLAAVDVQLETSAWWRSPNSGSRYPARWRLRLPRENLDLEIVPLLTDQELFATTVRYWEGAVAIRDLKGESSGGSGYVELTGYGEE